MRLLRGLAVVLAAALLAVACQGGDDPQPQFSGDVSELLGDPEKIVVGTSATTEPFEFVRDGEIVGFDIDLMNEIASRLGVEAEFVDVSFERLFRRLLRGRFDAAISAITITPERATTVTLTDPYFTMNQAVVTREGSDISGVDDLGDQMVAAVAGTAGLAYANETFTDSTIIEFPTADAAFVALESEQAAATFVDAPTAARRVEMGDSPLAVAAEVDIGEQYGIGVHPDDAALADAINVVIADLVADGTYEQLYTKWFAGDVPQEFTAGAD